MDKVIIICGSTASGKTRLALELAQKAQCRHHEIVNCDVAQCYEPLKIGSAAPTDEEQAIVPHHLFSFITEPILHTAFKHKLMIENICREIIARGKTPLIVGGAHFYIYTLFFSKSQEIAVEYNVHPGDTYRNERILRASCSQDPKDSIAQALIFEPHFDYEIVYKNTHPQEDVIKKRIKEMIALGWQEEVFQLNDSWKNFVIQRKFIGYKEIIEAQKAGSTLNLEAFIENTYIATRQYIKKQICFIKKLKKMAEDYNVVWREHNG